MKVPRRMVYGLVVAYLTALAFVIVSVQYANYVDTESNQRWCGLVSTLDDAYSSPSAPPRTKLGRKVAREIHALRNEFEC